MIKKKKEKNRDMSQRLKTVSQRPKVKNNVFEQSSLKWFTVYHNTDALMGMVP